MTTLGAGPGSVPDVHTPETLGTRAFFGEGSAHHRPLESPAGAAFCGRKGVIPMSGLFQDRSAAAYRRAAEAVQRGTASRAQRDLNDRAARLAGRLGNDARAAQRGELK